jgi:hypothetical protein
MPDIPINLSKDEPLVQVTIDKHSNMLIIGKGDTDFSIANPTYEEDPTEVAKRYGPNSELTACFLKAQALGVEYIFLMNIRNHYDFLSISDTIEQNDFAYVVPISIYLSETFTDVSNSNHETTYFSYLMNHLNIHNRSVFITTDKHASLYEDMDAFIKDMNDVEKKFCTNCYPGVNKENMIFVANNLEETKYANIYLAAALCTTDISLYPTANFGTAIFDIDQYDGIGSWAYFKNHYLCDCTVENLLNEAPLGSSQKIVTISRICKLIEREIDFTEFKGRQYTEYQRLRIAKKLELYLKTLTGYAIYKYKIESVQAYRGDPGTVTVLNRFKIWPVNSIAEITIEKGVEIGS